MPTPARREQNRRNSIRRYRRLIDAGLCTLCGRVHVVKFKRCLRCRRIFREYQRRWLRRHALSS